MTPHDSSVYTLNRIKSNSAIIQIGFQTARQSSSAKERPEKLQRLNSLRRAAPYCSKNALHGLLQDIQEHGLPELSDPKQMREATRSYLSKKEAYGPLFEEHEAKTVAGGTATFLLLNVFQPP